MHKKIYDIIRCRFVDNETDEVFYINQYGCGTEPIEDFWRSYFKDPEKDKYTFISCKVIQENVEVNEDDLREIWSKRLGINLNENNK